MLKQIDKKLLMDVVLYGKVVIIETNLGGIHERYSGTITKQRWSGEAQEVTLTVTNMIHVTVGIVAIKKVYINVDTVPKCPNCKRVDIFDQWVLINLPDYIVTENHYCPECDNSLEKL